MHLFRQAVQVAVILENTIVGIFQYAVIRTVSQSAARLLQGRAPHQNCGATFPDSRPESVDFLRLPNMDKQDLGVSLQKAVVPLHTIGERQIVEFRAYLF